MDREKLVVGVVQVILALFALAVVVGYLDPSPELLAFIIAIQNGLLGTRDVRKSQPPAA